MELISFSPSGKDVAGSTIVNYIDPNAPGTKGVYEIRNDVTKYNYQNLPGNSARRRQGEPPAVGYTSPNDPFTNYTISDRELHPSSNGTSFQEIVGGFISTQIHEVGNSIELASGNYIGKSSPGGDPDSGMQIQICVEKELRSQGYTGQ